MTIISSQGLKNLSNYKYSFFFNIYTVRYTAGLNGFFDKNIGTPFWDVCVSILPAKFAPNVLTLLSLLSSFVMYSVIWFYCPQMNEKAPSWVYLFSAFCVFLYQTLDAIDGKQARRLGMSNPLGQLLDHGCDSLGCMFFGYTTSSVLCFGFSIYAIIFFYIQWVPFFFCNWEQGETHLMRFGHFSISEGQLATFIVYVISYFIGTDIWVNFSIHFPFTIPFVGSKILISHALLFITGMVAIWQCFRSIIEVYRHCQNSLRSAFIKLFIFILLMAFSFLWTLSPHLFRPFVFGRAMIFTIGILFSDICNRVIISHVTKDSYTVPFSFYLLPFVVLLSYFSPLPLTFLVIICYIYMFIVFLNYILYSYGVIIEISSFTKIPFFTVPVDIINNFYKKNQKPEMSKNLKKSQ